MRTAGVLLSLLLSLTSRAQAQVSVDLRALDSPGPEQSPARAAPARPDQVPARRPAVVPAPPAPTATVSKPSRTDASASRPGAAAGTEGRAAKQSATASARPAQGKPARGTVTPAPIANVPAPALPVAQPSAPPASAMAPAPAASPLALPPPVRLVFKGGETDLTPADEAAIRELARSIPTPADDSINVFAYAAGKPDDPSTARRLSLSRGMAVRSVLMASGVPSAQIYVRALGAAATDGPADRVELIVARIGTVTR